MVLFFQKGDSKVGETEKTEVIGETIAPVWNKLFTFVCRAEKKYSHLRFTVRDSDGASSQFLGQV